MRITRLGSAFFLSALLASLLASAAPRAQSASPQSSGSPQTAQQFLQHANAEALRLSNAANRAGWVQSTFITPDTEIMAAEANGALINAVTRFAKEAAKFRDAQVSASERRQLDLLRMALTMAAPPDAGEAEELTRLAASMEGGYGRGKYCPEGVTGDDCLDIEEITEILAESRDPKRLQEVWAGWHTISIPMRKDYARFVELSNKGAKALGFADTGAMWRSKYDMPPEAFPKELDRLWQQLQPLYVSLHAYVRTRLREKYGAAIPEKGPMPAHLLGNLWQQDWSNIYDLVAPPDAAASFSLTDRLKAKKVDALEMVRIGERFFTSLGFAPLPKTFWERSLFVKPRDREVVCHASAWDIDNVEDLRIKMCIDVNAEDFTTIHHELGHNFYQRAYNTLPMLFRDSANDGFHEAVGDTLALSVTPEYLVRIRTARQGARRVRRYSAAASVGAGAAGVPAVRPDGRSMALAGVRRHDRAVELQPRLVGPQAEVSGRRAVRTPRRGVLRSRRQVSRAGEHALYALFPRGDPPVPVPSRARQGRRLHRAAASLLDLRQQGSR